MARSISYDWLEDAILSVCRPVFIEHAIEIESLTPRPQRVSPHQDFLFTLRSPDTEMKLHLRLSHGRFSLWKGTDTNKTTREFSALRLAYQHGIPVPFAFTYGPGRTPFGYPYIIMDAGDGAFWWENEKGFVSQQEEIIDDFAQRIAQIHAQITPQNPLIPPIFVSDVITLIRQHLEQQEDETALGWLRNCADQLGDVETLPAVLLHGNLHLDAIMMRNGAIRALTGWEHAAIGDPRWDIAQASLSLQQAGDRALANRFIARYTEQVDWSTTPIEVWEGLIALRNYALSGWLRSLDATGFQNIVGLQTDLFDLEEWHREFAQSCFQN